MDTYYHQSQFHFMRDVSIDAIAGIRFLREQCEKYQLEGREILARFSDEELARIYNGIGPETFPDWMRTGLDALHPSIKCVALIHDVEFELSDGTEEGFRVANERFRRNGIKVAVSEFSWYNPRRYLVMLDAVKYAALCQLFGWSFWARAQIKRAMWIARCLKV